MKIVWALPTQQLVSFPLLGLHTERRLESVADAIGGLAFGALGVQIGKESLAPSIYGKLVLLHVLQGIHR